MKDFLRPSVPAPIAAELPPDSWRENVAAIVLDAAGRVLLGLGTGHNAYWHFPQGGVGSRETQEAALCRELWEEAGLAASSYRIVACYGGLRYRYRKNNDKSSRWRGQEQTYFLVLCHEEMPATDCSRTDEFSTLTWVPWRELSSELFAPFKRKVVEKVLAAFFPPHLAEDELMPWVQNQLTPRRYRLAGRALAHCPADDRALFGGGKEEMENTLARLALRLRSAHKGMAAVRGRVLILLHGEAGSGRKQALRRLAVQLDPMRLRATRADAFAPGLPWELLQALPAAGEVSLVIHHASGRSPAQDWLQHEAWLMGQGIRVLKLYLHTGESAGEEALLAATDTEAAPWYIIPSTRRWYRDYLLSLLVATALEYNSGVIFSA